MLRLLRISGREYTENELRTTISTHTWIWDAKHQILILENFSEKEVYADGNLTIILWNSSNNTISGVRRDVLSVTGNLSIYGPGKLTLESRGVGHALSLDSGNLELRDSCTVTAHACESGCGIFIREGDITTYQGVNLDCIGAGDADYPGIFIKSGSVDLRHGSCNILGSKTAIRIERGSIDAIDASRGIRVKYDYYELGYTCESKFIQLSNTDTSSENQDANWIQKIEQSAKKGDLVEMYLMANMYHTGRGIMQDFATARSWYEMAGTFGYVPAYYQLGTLSESRGEAKTWFEKGATLGHRGCMVRLGMWYELGSSANPETAATWYQKAAKLGSAHAMYRLGRLYEYGTGNISKDRDQALRYYQNAGEHGCAAACFRLGYLSQQNMTKPGDRQKVIDHYERAIRFGHRFAQCYLGWFYECQNDHQNAITCYTNSVQNEIVFANYLIGYLYQYGKGVPQSHRKAESYYEIVRNSDNQRIPSPLLKASTDNEKQTAGEIQKYLEELYHLDDVGDDLPVIQNNLSKIICPQNITFRENFTLCLSINQDGDDYCWEINGKKIASGCSQLTYNCSDPSERCLYITVTSPSHQYLSSCVVNILPKLLSLSFYPHSIKGEVFDGVSTTLKILNPLDGCTNYSWYRDYVKIGVGNEIHHNFTSICGTKIGETTLFVQTPTGEQIGKEIVSIIPKPTCRITTEEDIIAHLPTAFTAGFDAFEIDEYLWEVSSNETAFDRIGTGWTCTHTFTQSGQHTIRLTVINRELEFTATCEKSVEAHPVSLQIYGWDTNTYGESSVGLMNYLLVEAVLRRSGKTTTFPVESATWTADGVKTKNKVFIKPFSTPGAKSIHVSDIVLEGGSSLHGLSLDITLTVKDTLPDIEEPAADAVICPYQNMNLKTKNPMYGTYVWYLLQKDTVHVDQIGTTYSGTSSKQLKPGTRYQIALYWKPPYHILLGDKKEITAPEPYDPAFHEKITNSDLIGVRKIHRTIRTSPGPDMTIKTENLGGQTARLFEGTTIRFSCTDQNSCAANCHTSVSHSWELTDNQNTWKNGCGNEIEYHFDEPGKYTLHVTRTCPGTTISAEHSFQILPVFHYPQQIFAGISTEISLEKELISPRDILNWKINNTDISPLPADPAKISYTFPNSGTYTLTVKNYRKIITVLPAPTAEIQRSSDSPLYEGAYEDFRIVSHGGSVKTIIWTVHQKQLGGIRSKLIKSGTEQRFRINFPEAGTYQISTEIRYQDYPEPVTCKMSVQIQKIRTGFR